MNPLENQINSINSLPPSFETLSQFLFGKFIIELNIEQLQSLSIKRFQFQFLGGKSSTQEISKNKKSFSFPIKTSLWHFYHYLKDMENIKIHFQGFDQSMLQCVKKIELFSTSKVMSKAYVKGNYVANSMELCDIFTQSGQKKGYVMVKVKLQFDQELHKQIAQKIDFSSLQNNPEQFNKESVEPQNRFPNPIQNSKKSQIGTLQSKILVNQQNLPNYQNLIQTNLSQVKHTHEQDSRMVEDDIDRMIAQMQNKPYDSSRYLDNPSTNSFVNGQKNYQHDQSNRRSNFHFSQSLADYSKQNQYQNNLNNSQRSRSKSPNLVKKYPPIPLPNRGNNNSQHFGTTTIYSQKSLSPGPNSRNRSLNKTQKNPYQRSMKSISSNVFSSTGFLPSSAHKGTLKIQMHQLLGRELQDDGLILKVFINNQYDQLFACKGLLEGQVIVYNQKTQIAECILSDIQKLRFELQNWENQVLYASTFEMNRLLSIQKLEGIFMLNLHHCSQQFYGNSVVASQTILKKMQRPPNQRTLRITLSFTQQIQVIQMYLNLSKISLNFQKCKYKIPFTKQTVQFEPTQNHFNIFPHNKSYPKLMIEFWDQKSIIGASEINLSNLKTITKNILECNIEPIYLYDCMFPIKNLFNQNQVGKFKLLVCCGNVRQIQHVLNKNMQSRITNQSDSMPTNSKINQVQVEYDKKLGVFIKDRKIKQQIQIQVDTNQLSNNDQKQTQQKQHRQVSMVSQNQFLQNSLKQNALSKTLSKTHSMKLSQQEIQSDSEEVIQKKDKNIQFNPKKRQSSQHQELSISKQLNIDKAKSFKEQIKKQEMQPPKLKILSSLSKIICKRIQESFKPLIQNNFSVFQELKALCKPHLLFNFIDIDILIKFMIEIGVSKMYINLILQILQPLNGMVNFNLLNDFLVSLEIQNQIKQNSVPAKLFIKLTLQIYYQAACKLISQSIEINYQSWLSENNLRLISTLDEGIDFNEMRKLFNDLNFKISMNQYNILKCFFQNQTEIKSFLFELAQSKTSYQQIIKSQKNIFQMLKLTIIQEVINKKKQQELSKKYEQNIIDRLYDSKMRLNDQNSQIDESMTDSRLGQEYPQKSTILPQKTRNYQQKSNPGSKILQSFAKKSFEDQEQDDFIINNLNNKAKSQTITEMKQINSFEKQKQKQNYGQSQPQYKQRLIKQPDLNNTNYDKYKQNCPKVSLTKSGTASISYLKRRKILISGLQNCKSTYQCQLDQQLQTPYLKIVIQSPYQKNLYFKQSDQNNQQEFQINFSNGKDTQNQDDQEIEGHILLNDVTKKGQIQVAMARFVVIKGIKSVYALKTLQEEQFCGLVNILIDE